MVISGSLQGIHFRRYPSCKASILPVPATQITYYVDIQMYMIHCLSMCYPREYTWEADHLTQHCFPVFYDCMDGVVVSFVLSLVVNHYNYYVHHMQLKYICFVGTITAVSWMIKVFLLFIRDHQSWYIYHFFLNDWLK